MRLDSKSILLGSLLFAVGCASPSTSGRHCSIHSMQQDRVARLVSVAQKYERDGNGEMARQVYAQVVAQNPDNQLAQSALKRLAPASDVMVPEQVPMTPSAELLAELRSQRIKTEGDSRKIERNNDQRHLDEIALLPEISEMVAELQELDQLGSSPAADAHNFAETGEIETSEFVAPPFPSELDVVDESATTEVVSQSAVASSDTPRWGLDKTLEIKEAVPTKPTTKQAASKPKHVADAEQDHWDHLFDDDLPMPDSPQAQLTDVVEGGSESDTTDLLNEIPVREFAGFDESHRGWQPTDLSRLCPDLEPELKPVVEQLGSKSETERISALVKLRHQGAEAKTASRAVRSLWEDESELVRVYAASTTSEIETHAWDSVQALTNSLKSDQPEVVHLAAYMLGKMGPAAIDAADELSQLRDAELNVTSVYAAEALTRITPDDGRSFDQLSQALHSEDADLRWFAAVTMGNSTEANSERAVAVLAKALNDDHPNVRTAAALSLGGFGEEAHSALPNLEQLAEVDNVEVREAALTAIACVKQTQL